MNVRRTQVLLCDNPPSLLTRQGSRDMQTPNLLRKAKRRLRVAVSTPAVAAMSLWAMLESRLPGSMYRFTLGDVALHLRERLWAPKPGIEVSRAKGLVELRFDDVSIHWPSDLEGHGLSWMYEEVFADFAVNPSSYDHASLWDTTPSWVLDAGSCEGFYTYNALLRGVEKVVAVEPLEPIAFALERSIVSWGASDRVRVVTSALADEPNVVGTLLTDPKLPWESRVGSAGQRSAVHAAPVAITTIDAIVSSNALTGPGLIKMDVEGSEMSVLYGAQNTLATLSPRLAIAVYHDWENAKLCRDIILAANPHYKTVFRGLYGWFKPARPYMLFAWVPRE